MGEMQDKIMASLRLIASDAGLEFVNQAEQCSTGIVYLQHGFDTAAEIAYCFLSGYCTITFRGQALSAAGLPDVPSAKSTGEDGLTWHHLAYGNGRDIRAMLAAVESALAAPGDRGHQAALSVS